MAVPRNNIIALVFYKKYFFCSCSASEKTVSVILCKSLNRQCNTLLKSPKATYFNFSVQFLQNFLNWSWGKFTHTYNNVQPICTGAGCKTARWTLCIRPTSFCTGYTLGVHFSYYLKFSYYIIYTITLSYKAMSCSISLPFTWIWECAKVSQQGDLLKNKQTLEHIKTKTRVLFQCGGWKRQNKYSFHHCIWFCYLLCEMIMPAQYVV